MSRETVYYDIVQKRFVYNTTGLELAIKDYPSITFKEQKVLTWNIGKWDSTARAFTNIDLSQFSINVWQSSVDVDFTRATEPMIRVLNANIDSSQAKDGIINVNYNADTKEFEKAVDGQADGQRKVYIELKGYDNAGRLAFFSRPRLAQVYGEMQIDPGTDPVGETTSNYYTKSESDGRFITRAKIPPNIETTDHKNQSNGYAGLDENSKLTGAQQVYGTTANTACEGNDSRLSNSRHPVAHAQTHISGTDVIQFASASQNGLMTADYASKLDDIETNADVTNASNVGSSIRGTNVKSSPVDIDEFALIDSEDSNVLKKTFWSSIKSNLKSYFDTLYLLILGTPAKGDIIYYNGTNYTLLNAGINGQYLKTQGANANPIWSTPAGSGDVIAPATNTDNYIPQWNGDNSKTLKNGYPISATPSAAAIALGDSSGKLDSWITDAVADGSTKGKAAFIANDFNASSGVVSIDYTNGQKASDTQPGFLTELATSSEVTTGTDSTRAITPDSLARSIFGVRAVNINVIEANTNITTGDGKGYFGPLPSALNGMHLISAKGRVKTAGSTNTTTIQVHNVTKSLDMLSSPISIASGNVLGSGVVDSSYDNIATDDFLQFDINSVSSTPPKGLFITLEFQLP